MEKNGYYPIHGNKKKTFSQPSGIEISWGIIHGWFWDKIPQKRITALLLKAESLYLDKRYKNAIVQCKKALMIDQDNKDAQKLMAKLVEEQRKAKEWAEKQITLEKQRQKKISELLAEANTLYLNKKCDDAIAKCREVLAIDSDNKSAQKLIAREERARAEKEKTRKLEEERIRTVRKNTADWFGISPANVTPEQIRQYIRQKAEKEKAREKVRKNRIAEIKSMAKSLYSAKKYGDAIAKCMQILKIDPNNTYAPRMIKKAEENLEKEKAKKIEEQRKKDLIAKGWNPSGKFKNAHLGMTKEEVSNTITMNKKLWFDNFRLRDKYWKNKNNYDNPMKFVPIGTHSVDVHFSYHDGKLYKIILVTPERTADYINSLVQEELDFFYDVFKKKFGEPTYHHESIILGKMHELNKEAWNLLGNTLKGKSSETHIKSEYPRKKINLFDFKDNYYVFIYGWEDKDTKRYIALSSSDFEYGISVLIIDNKLEKAKEAQEKKHEDSEKHKALENF